MWSAVSGALTIRLLTLLGAPQAAFLPVHDVWADGSAVPEWVRNACCGPSDVHHLQPSEVHRRPGGFAIDGVQALVPWAKTLPSEDGDYWIFYRDFADGSQYVFCFFAPPEGT